jgi:hypothetical protein
MNTAKHLTFDKLAGEILAGTFLCELVLVTIYWFDVLSAGHFLAPA